MLSIIKVVSKNLNNCEGTILFSATMFLRSKLKRSLESTSATSNENFSTSKRIKDETNSLCNSTVPTAPTVPSEGNIPEQFLNIIAKMNTLLKEIKFSAPVDFIYNPTEYAHHTFSMYINRYCNSPKDVLFLGMNPGPWGMVQTGVPFGEIPITRDWLQIVGPVGKPPRELGLRPVTGFDCHRSEVSGKRYWGLFKELCGTPENFFKHAFTYNYCPLALMKANGQNITPADIKGAASDKLMKICDEALYEVIKLLEVKVLVGVGRYAEKRANTVMKEYSVGDVKVVFLPHPSPRVVGNENWQEKAVGYLNDLDLMKYFKKQ